MNYFLPIIFTLLSTWATAQKNVIVVIIDGYTNEPIENCAVQITANNKTIHKETTSKDGLLELDPKVVKKAQIEILNDDNQSFIRHDIRHYKKLPDTILVHMIPTREYEEKMFALEGEKYGSPCSKADIYKIDALTSENDSLFVDAIFGNGPADMHRYISMNVEYPDIARMMGDQGMVYIEFIVEKDGAITHVKTLRSVSEELDNEAKRVIRSMRHWTPGEYNGEKVRTCCTLPIRFVLD